MSSSLVPLVGACIILTLVQWAAALPWLLALDFRLRLRFRQPRIWIQSVAICLGIGAGIGLLLDYAGGNKFLLDTLGRVYASIFQIQLGADIFVGAFFLLLQFWPKGGAVALSAFREGIRQPMFWLLFVSAFILMGVFLLLPYFTFGEDLKMIKELCYAITMLAPALFGVIEASMSVSEEIEGRTAVTLMSKPVSRRQFLLGKFSGLLVAGMFMTLLLGWWLVWVVYFGGFFTRLPGTTEPPDPAWVVNLAKDLYPASSPADLVHGMAMWTDESLDALPGLVIGFCQVMVLLAISVALATRVPMLVNLVVCLAVYFLGHLTPVLTEVTRLKYPLIYFFAQVFDTLFPGLDLFDVGPAIVRESRLLPLDYGLYTMNVTLYALMYTTIALLFGLILFEDRDLA